MGDEGKDFLDFGYVVGGVEAVVEILTLHGEAAETSIGCIILRVQFHPSRQAEGFIEQALRLVDEVVRLVAQVVGSNYRLVDTPLHLFGRIGDGELRQVLGLDMIDHRSVVVAL